MRPLPFLALGVVLGAFFWPHLQPDYQVAAFAGGCCLLLALRSRPALFGAGLCLGLALPGRTDAGPDLRGEVVVRGVAGSADGGGFVLDTTGVAAAGQATAAVLGPVRVRGGGNVPAPGARVVVRGEAHPLDLTHLPGEADPAIDAARLGIRSEVRATEVRVIGPASRAVRTDGAVHAGLIAALTKGERAELPPEEANLLRRTGTWHLVSVSGLHIAMVALLAGALAWGVLRPLRLVGAPGLARWGPAAVAIAAACAYAAWSGWPVPARRSVVMVAVASCARAAARHPDPWDVLALAALAIVSADPAAPGSVSFQLSFSAMIGAGLWSPRAMRLLPPDGNRLVTLLVASLASSAGATIGTLPIIAWRFGTLPRWGPFANLWAIPWIGSVATPAALAGQVLPGRAGTFALAVADGAIDLGLWGLTFLDGAPIPFVVGPLGALILTVAALLPRRPLVAMALASLSWVPPSPGDALRIWVLSVGQGAATLVEWPDGRRWLVDAGPPGTAIGPALRRLGVTHLDEIVLSHAHPDHFGGIPSVLAAIRVDGIRATTIPAGIAPGVPRIDPDSPAPGFTRIRPDPAFVPESENDRSLVLRLCAARCVLLPGDVEAPAEAALLGQDLHADVALLAHHGSATSSTPAFVAAIDAPIGIIPVGFDNRYAHPRIAALSAWRGRTIYRTDLDGTLEVTLRADGVEVVRVDPPNKWMLR